MNTPHKHAEVIKAWADGEMIQWRNGPSMNWHDYDVDEHPYGPWSDSEEWKNAGWRIKPEKKTGWLAISKGLNSSFSLLSADEAKSQLVNNCGGVIECIACIQIEYTEGEGL